MGMIFWTSTVVGQPIITPMPEEVDVHWNLAWHSKAADMGDADSQYYMAEAFSSGALMPANPQKAVEYYKKAASQAHTLACMRLGVIYTNNEWLRSDMDQALFWYKMAAAQNHAPAMIRLSQIYETMSPPNYTLAYEWMERAMGLLFPETLDLIAVSPDLARLKELKTNNRGDK